jgi:magnesium transporter
MAIQELLTTENYTWYDIQDPKLEDFEKLSSEFNLPALLIQDTLRPEHLPKYENTEGGHFMMMRSYDNESGPDASTVQGLTRKIALFIRGKKIMTIHRVELDFLKTFAEKTKKSGLPRDIQDLAHQIILSIIRTYDEPADSLQDVYDDFEAVILTTRRESLDMSRIYQFRRQLFVMKKLLRQSGDAILRSKDFWVDSPSLLQDLKENLDQVYFELDEISGNFEHLFQVHIALNDQRTNDVMKILTVFSAVLLPLNFLASFYGMNFTQIPGLDSEHTLMTVVLIMILICVVAIWYFRRKGWFKSVD